MPGNMHDAPLAVQTRKKRKSYHDLKSDEDSTDETLSVDSDSDFNSVLGDAQTQPEDDPDVTCIEFTNRPVPGYQELRGDIFQVRQQRQKRFRICPGPVYCGRCRLVRRNCAQVL